MKGSLLHNLTKLVKADGATSVGVEKLKGCPVEGVGDAQPAFKFMEFFKGYQTEKVDYVSYMGVNLSEVLY